MGEEVHVLLKAITLHSRAMSIEIAVFVWIGGGTLSGHCPVHNLTPQSVRFRSFESLVH